MVQQQQKEHFEKGCEVYISKQNSGGVDLINEVRDILIGEGLGRQVETYFDTNELILQSVGKDSVVQRFNLNRYWTLQILASNDPRTSDVRYHLIHSGNPSDWLDLFKEGVVPFIVHHHLPKQL